MAYEPKTKKNDASVEEFLAQVEPPYRREDSRVVCALMAEATGEPPAMWGHAIVGFGEFPLVYASGKSLNWPLIGFSPRKQDLTLYIAIGNGFEDHRELLAKLGKHKTSKACLYIKKLADVDVSVLREMIENTVAHHRAKPVE